MGEDLACHSLARWGVVVVARNVMVGRGEIDVVGRIGGRPVAFEVRSRVGGDARDGLDEAKVEQVRGLAARLDPPVWRVDGVTVDLLTDRVDLRWLPDL